MIGLNYSCSMFMLEFHSLLQIQVPANMIFEPFEEDEKVEGKNIKESLPIKLMGKCVEIIVGTKSQALWYPWAASQPATVNYLTNYPQLFEKLRCENNDVENRNNFPNNS